MNIDRKDIRIINRYSDLSEKQVDKILKAHVYNSPESWQKFLRLLFISLGIAFTTAGILFFFAYNWADLHKFIKLGLVEGLIITLTSVVLFSNIKIDIKHIIITGTAILVGVLFAVFGQIYQTGANAYDFFLGWTIFITLWVVVLNFPPLWLVFITLVNTTLILYSEQVAHGWSAILLSTLLFSINLLFLVAFIITSKTVETIKTPNWFLNIIKNAIMHNNHKGSIDIILEGNLLQIINTGQKLLNKENIFKRFVRSNNKDSLGIGLSIVKKICNFYYIDIDYSFDEKHRFNLNFRDEKKLL
jgi:uncharacterized membrane protein